MGTHILAVRSGGKIAVRGRIELPRGT